MQKWIMVLSGLLLAQLVLALAVNLSGEDYGAYEAEDKLLGFETQAVDAVRIESEGKELLLEKRDQRWVLPAQHDFPADPASVQRLLDELAGLEQGWPVATTDSAIRRFKVAEDAFQTRLSLLSGDQVLGRLYLGTSPGFRKVHMRPAEEEAVFAVNFDAWEASANSDDWIDKDRLKLDAETVERIELSDIELTKDETGLHATDLGEQETTDQAAARQLLDKITGLRIQSLLGTERPAEFAEADPAFQIQLQRKQGDPLQYRFYKPDQGAFYVLQRSDMDYYFKLPEFGVQPILESTREKLVKQTGEAGANDDE